jgi:DNA polymerase
VPILFRDYETRSTIDLRDVGAWKYSMHCSTDVWCCAFAVDDGPIKLWVPGDPTPAEFVEAAQNPAWLVSAFNDNFERLIEQHIMAPRYGWPLIPLERHRCTQAAALALALPAKLKTAALALALEQQKSSDETMRSMAKPRKPRKGEDPNGIYWNDTPERLEQLHAYCKQDVATERELHERTGHLSNEEQTLWQLDAIVNDRGIYLDAKLLDAAIRIGEAARAAINAELRTLTGGAVETINQPKLAEWLATNGCEVTDLQKTTLKCALTRKQIPEAARRAIGLRLDGAHAAVAKYQTMRDWLCEDGRIRGALKYHGAATGRWTSYGVQFQNFKKPLVEDIGAGSKLSRLVISTTSNNFIRSRCRRLAMWRELSSARSRGIGSLPPISAASKAG